LREDVPSAIYACLKEDGKEAKKEGRVGRGEKTIFVEGREGDFPEEWREGGREGGARRSDPSIPFLLFPLLSSYYIFYLVAIDDTLRERGREGGREGERGGVDSVTRHMDRVCLRLRREEVTEGGREGGKEGGRECV